MKAQGMGSTALRSMQKGQRFCLIPTCHLPSTMLSSLISARAFILLFLASIYLTLPMCLHILPHLILTSPWGRLFYFPHFIYAVDKKILSNPPNVVDEQRFKPRKSDSRRLHLKTISSAIGMSRQCSRQWALVGSIFTRKMAWVILMMRTEREFKARLSAGEWYVTDSLISFWTSLSHTFPACSKQDFLAHFQKNGPMCLCVCISCKR